MLKSLHLSFCSRFFGVIAAVAMAGCEPPTASTELSAAEEASMQAGHGTTSGISSTLDSISTAAKASQILFGAEALDSAGRRITGTMPDYGAFDVSTTALTAAGYISSFSGLSTSDVCSTKALFGAVGAASCVLGAADAQGKRSIRPSLFG
jgi:hypothetical protein